MQTYRLNHLDCANCALKIEKRLQETEGVTFAAVNFATATLYLESNSLDAARRAIADVEPQITLESVTSNTPRALSAAQRWQVVLMAVSAVLFGIGSTLHNTLHSTLFQWLEYAVLLPAYLLCGFPVLKNALTSLRNRQAFDENFLMSVATLGAIAIHEIPEAVGVMLFYQIGEFLQNLAVGRSRRSIESLLTVRPEYVNSKTAGDVMRVASESVPVGAQILVHPGERVLLDRHVVAGESTLEAAALTGEAATKFAGPGAEAHATHPIAQSLRAAYNRTVHPPEFYETFGGQGLRAQNDGLMHRFGVAHPECHFAGTAVWVAVDGQYAGAIQMADAPKPESAAAIAVLRQLGVRYIAMLTGDAPTAATEVAAQLGLDDFHASLLPEDKLRSIETTLQTRPGKLAFVGDGINDTPALARADVGIAMGDLGTQAAIETADVTLMNDSPLKVAEAIQVARGTRAIVWQNIILALLVKVFFITLGAFGVASMWEAVFADMGVALLAISNASRVR